MMVPTMFSIRARLAACLGLASAALVGCSPGGGPDAADGMSGSGSAAGTSGGTTAAGSGGRAGSASNSGGSQAAGNGSGGTGSMATGGAVGSGGTTTVPGDVPTDALLPARIRRLTTAEYAATVQSLLGVAVPEAVSLPPDTRQDGFTRNESQRVDPVLVKQLDASAQTLAAAARPTFATRAPCSEAAGSEACARSFIETFGAKAFRRPLATEEVSDLVALYHLAKADGSYEDGIELTLRAMLQSTAFLYVTELGDGSGGERVQLTSHELANSLSYLLTAGPPDEALIAAAQSGVLDTADGRALQALRLLESGAPARTAVLRQLREWLGLDRMLETGKDTTAYTGFTPEVRTAMDAETLAFFGEITFDAQNKPKMAGSIGEVLGADWTMVDRNLAAYYGLTYPAGADGFARVPYSDARRRGILNQGAFLSIYAHASESSPILRGVSVLKRLLCSPPQTPAEAGVDIPPSPQPDGQTTTRERYENVHGQAPLCKGCHISIDAVGFTFEQFDGAGHLRFEKGDELYEFEKSGEVSGKIDSTTTIEPDLLLPVSGDFANSGELAQALSESAEVRACYARHLFRSVAAASGASVRKSEDAYIAAWSANPAAEPGSIIESLVTFVTSPLFAYRRAQ